MIAAVTCIDIAARHRLHRSGRGWRGNCPACGYADAFAMSEGRNGTPLLYCASCQDRAALVTAVGMMLREPTPADATERDAASTRKQEAALRLWHGSEPAWQTLAMAYLMSRHLNYELSRCPDLRFRLDCPHPQSGRLPAMVALVRDAGGEPLAIHRTYLRRDGTGKADVEPAKASLGPVWGGAIRLALMAAEMVIGEGIETAASAGCLTGLPAWAAINAGNLATGLVLPVGVRSVVIAVDRDPAGERAAATAAGRWQAEGRHVRLLIPDLPGTDAADVLRAREVIHA